MPIAAAHRETIFWRSADDFPIVGRSGVLLGWRQHKGRRNFGQLPFRNEARTLTKSSPIGAILGRSRPNLALKPRIRTDFELICAAAPCTFSGKGDPRSQKLSAAQLRTRGTCCEFAAAMNASAQLLRATILGDTRRVERLVAMGAPAASAATGHHVGRACARGLGAELRASDRILGRRGPRLATACVCLGGGVDGILSVGRRG